MKNKKWFFISAALKQFSGSMPVEKACKEIYDYSKHTSTCTFKNSRILPRRYRNQIDKKLDKIMQKLAS